MTKGRWDGKKIEREKPAQHTHTQKHRRLTLSLSPIPAQSLGGYSVWRWLLFAALAVPAWGAAAAAWAAAAALAGRWLLIARGALYYLTGARAWVERLVVVGLLTAAWAVAMPPAPRGSTAAGVRAGGLNTAACAALACGASLAATLGAKALSGHFYRAAHFDRMQEALKKVRGKKKKRREKKAHPRCSFFRRARGRKGPSKRARHQKRHSRAPSPPISLSPQKEYMLIALSAPRPVTRASAAATRRRLLLGGRREGRAVGGGVEGGGAGGGAEPDDDGDAAAGDAVEWSAASASAVMQGEEGAEGGGGGSGGGAAAAAPAVGGGGGEAGAGVVARSAHSDPGPACPSRSAPPLPCEGGGRGDWCDASTVPSLLSSSRRRPGGRFTSRAGSVAATVAPVEAARAAAVASLPSADRALLAALAPSSPPPRRLSALTESRRASSSIERGRRAPAASSNNQPAPPPPHAARVAADASLAALARLASGRGRRASATSRAFLGGRAFSLALVLEEGGAAAAAAEEAGEEDAAPSLPALPPLPPPGASPDGDFLARLHAVERHLRKARLRLSFGDALASAAAAEAMNDAAGEGKAADAAAASPAVAAKARARRLAFYLFWNAAPSPAATHLTRVDLAVFLPGPGAADAALVALDADGDGFVSRGDMREAVAAILSARANLAATLRDARSVVGRLRGLLLGVAHGAAFFLYLAIWNVNITKLW